MIARQATLFFLVTRIAKCEGALDHEAANVMTAQRRQAQELPVIDAGRFGTLRLVADITPPGFTFLGPTHMTPFQDKLYFAARGGTSLSEVWSYDDVSGARLVADLSFSAFRQEYRPEFIVWDDKLYFGAEETNPAPVLWAYDGISDPVIAADNMGGSVGDKIVYNDKLFFGARGKVWSYDPNEGSTDANLEADINGAGFFTHYDNKFFLSGLEVGGFSNEDRRLWSYDGTSFNVFSETSNVHNLVVYNDLLYFEGTDPDDCCDSKLRSYDGATDTISNVADLNTPIGFPYAMIGPAVGPDNKLYIWKNDAETGIEPWVYDGSSFSLVADINPGAGDSFPSSFVAFDNKLFFRASDGINGEELWVFDGETAEMVANIHPSGDSTPAYFSVFNDRLYFQADDGVHGIELWELEPIPTSAPTVVPTLLPTSEPTTASPTLLPTGSPTILPTGELPTAMPTDLPTTEIPSPISPTNIPQSEEPTSTEPTSATTEEEPTLLPTSTPLPTTEPLPRASSMCSFKPIWGVGDDFVCLTQAFT